MKKVELLAPAGDLSKLKIAIHYGADAVYLAGPDFGLRTASKNFTMDDIKEAVNFCHDRNRKLYVTMNIIAHNEDFSNASKYIKELVAIGVDALIVSDPGMYQLIRQIDSDIEIHFSTQASITNYYTVKFWRDMDVKRTVLARELSLEEIREIKRLVPDESLEVFAHGAMCISYSGRCLLSNYMTGRDANRGDCAQACRWKYHLVEEKRPGEYFPIEQVDGKTYIFNSKDLCMIEHISDMIEAGIDSLKIEGRVKSQYYVATVVRSYRLAIDAYYNNKYTKERANELLEEIKKVSYRDFTTGFFYDKPTEDAQLYESTSYIRNYDFVAMVLDYNPETKIATLEQRNRIFKGDTVEIFGPEESYHTITLNNLWDEMGNEVEVLNKAKQIFNIKLPFEVKPFDMVRKRI